MAFKPEAVQPDFGTLRTSLANAAIAVKQNALYQTINGLIDRTQGARDLLVKNIEGINIRIGDVETIINNNLIGNFTEGSIPFGDVSHNLTEDNSSLFWDNVNKRLGIGTSTPETGLNVVGNDDEPSQIRNERTSNDTSGPWFRTVKSRLGLSANIGDNIGRYGFTIRNSIGVVVPLAAFSSFADAVVSGGEAGYFDFATKGAADGAITARMRLSAAGNLSIFGNGTAFNAITLLHLKKSEPRWTIETTRADDPRSWTVVTDFENATDGSVWRIQDDALGTVIAINKVRRVGIKKISPVTDFDVEGYINWIGQKRVTTQFDKTNDAALANITGLSVDLVAGKSYYFEAFLFIDADLVGGSQYAIAGTATATSIKYEIELLDEATDVFSIVSRQTALAGAAGQAGTTTGRCKITGLIVVNLAGTLTVQFAQNAATPATTSSVLTNSHFIVQELV